jgi:hypothetical protein
MGGSVRAFGIFAALGLALLEPQPLVAQPLEENIAIEQLLTSGWQIAGYSTADNRSALILFKHPSETYLVQCHTGYDVTRTPRVHVNCYAVR